MAHDKRQITINGKQLWFHLRTDSLNVSLVKKAWARCWIGPLPNEDAVSSSHELIPGSLLQLELNHHNDLKRGEGNDIGYLEVHLTGARSFDANSTAQLTLPDGQVIVLHAKA